MTAASSLLSELDREAKSTEAVLARVPAGKLDWAPHPKSMTIGALAAHIAAIPARVAQLLQAGKFDVRMARPAPTRDTDDFVALLRRSLTEAKEVIAALDDEALGGPMLLVRGDEVLRQLTKAALIRNVLINHTIHHRGQLTVFLRLLDIPVPAIFGTSADESAF